MRSVGGMTGGDDRAVSGADRVEWFGVERGVLLLFVVEHERPGVAEQFGHLCRRGLGGGLGDGLELADVMGVALGVGDVVVAAIRRPAVVDEHTGEVTDDAHRVHRHGATFVVEVVEGELGRRDHLTANGAGHLRVGKVFAATLTVAMFLVLNRPLVNPAMVAAVRAELVPLSDDLDGFPAGIVHDLDFGRVVTLLGSCMQQVRTSLTPSALTGS